MAKRNTFAEAILEMAKTGHSKIKLAVYPGDVETLMLEGYNVDIPVRFGWGNTNAKQEVTISWVQATTGEASDMWNLVEEYRRKNNCVYRDHLTSEGKAAKEALKDFSVNKHKDSLLSSEDEEYYEEIAKRYATDDPESERDEDFTGINCDQFYAAEDAQEDARWVAYLASCEIV